jgi:hypothetical protein
VECQGVLMQGYSLEQHNEQGNGCGSSNQGGEPRMATAGEIDLGAKTMERFPKTWQLHASTSGSIGRCALHRASITG